MSLCGPLGDGEMGGCGPKCAAAASVKGHHCNWQGNIAGPAPLATAEGPDRVQ